jgi:two-component system cell cycle response regulator
MAEATSNPETPAKEKTQDPELLSREELIDLVKALKGENSVLKKEIVTDPLTEIYNRRGFIMFGEKFHTHAQREGEPYAVFVADIDNFKRINDTFGHEVGDTILKTVAHSLTEATRDADVVGRTGGDEFAGFLVDYTQEGFEKLAKRFEVALETSLKQSLSGNMRGEKVAVSLGFATWRGEQALNEVIKKADENMYKEKEENKNGK